jgi:hypothetical protein
MLIKQRGRTIECCNQGEGEYATLHMIHTIPNFYFEYYLID